MILKNIVLQGVSDLFGISDVTSCAFVKFQVWDLPGHFDYFDSNFDSEHIFGGCGALIFVIDSQVSILVGFVCLPFETSLKLVDIDKH